MDPSGPAGHIRLTAHPNQGSEGDLAWPDSSHRSIGVQNMYCQKPMPDVPTLADLALVKGRGLE
jgi:hypothetical protein